MSNKVRGKNSFNSAWLDDDRFKAWLAAVPNRNDLARCKIYNINFKIDNGGVSNIISHTKSTYSTTVTKSTAKDKASNNKNTALENLRVPLSSTEAEIRWV